jgi:amino acid transporter
VSEEQSHGLARNAVNTLEVFGQSLAATGPSIATAGTIPLVYLTAGSGTIYALIFGTVIVLLVGQILARFARRTAGAASLYGYTALGLGRVPAFATAWGLIIGYVFIAAACFVGVALYAGALISEAGGPGGRLGIQLLLLVIAGLLGTAGPVLGIRISARIGIVLEAISMLAITGALIATIAHYGAHFDTSQFAARGSSLTGIVSGTVFAVTIFVGFESAGSLGAEASDVFQSIPKAILRTAVFAGIFYIVAGYVLVIGFSRSNGLAASAAPLNEIAHTAGVGWLSPLLDLGITVSALACGAACVNAAARGLYNLARENVLPLRFAALGTVHRTRLTPHVALSVLGAIATVVPLVMVASGGGELAVYGDTAAIGTFGYLLAYLLVALGAPRFARGLGTLVISVLAAASIVFVIYKNLVPVPAWPTLLLPYVFAALLLAGLAWYGILYRRQPHRARQLGSLSESAEIASERERVPA